MIVEDATCQQPGCLRVTAGRYIGHNRACERCIEAYWRKRRDAEERPTDPARHHDDSWLDKFNGRRPS